MFYSQELQVSVSRNQTKLSFWKRREEDPYIKQRHKSSQPEIDYHLKLPFWSIKNKRKNSCSCMCVWTRKISDPCKLFRHTSKFQTHAKFQTRKMSDPRQNFIDPRKPSEPRKFSTHVIHAPTYPRIHVTHATHEPTQPTQFSRLSLK